MKKSNSGIIALLTTYKTSEMRKVLDIKFTPSYPGISIPSDFELFDPENNSLGTGFQHITIPPDLRIHFTDKTGKHIFIDDLVNKVDKEGNLAKECVKILTLVNRPIAEYPPFTNRSYKGGGMVIGLPPSPNSSDTTAHVLELFAMNGDHRNIPPEERFSTNGQGTLLPIHYEQIYGVKNNRKPANFYLLPCTSIVHNANPNEMLLFVGNSKTPYRLNKK